MLLLQERVLFGLRALQSERQGSREDVGAFACRSIWILTYARWLRWRSSRIHASPVCGCRPLQGSRRLDRGTGVVFGGYFSDRLQGSRFLEPERGRDGRDMGLWSGGAVRNQK